MPTPQILQAGSGVLVKLNGNLAGYATGMNFVRILETKVVKEIDNPFAAEIMPTSYSVQGTLTGLRVRGSGGLDGYGVMNVATPLNYFTQQYCVIEVVDILSKITIYTFQKVVFDQDSWNIQSRALLTFSASFKAVFVQNEYTPNAPPPPKQT
jgi:hypothetical protein